MPREKLPPRLYLDNTRGQWVIRYDGWTKRTGFSREEEAEAQAVLAKVLGKASWVRGIRTLPRRRRTPSVPPWCRDNTAGLVYFVSATDHADYPIKVGFCAGNIEKRLCELQVGNPHRLLVLASHPATYAQEQAIHARLARHQLSGEWFERSHLVLSALDAAQGGSLIEWLDAKVAA